ncbi:MAG TPA: phosphatase PAP2 family protein [Chloroflexota bacterium]|nr:phosphatase PAP2 family protein [Chloroflexota bacterium]
MLAGYFALLIAALDLANVRAGVEIMTVAVIAAAVVITRKPAEFVRDWWFLLLGLVMWNLSGPVAAHSPFPAHLDFMWRIDRILFAGHDPVYILQHSLLHPGHVGPLDVATAVAYNMHLPEPYLAGYFLWRLDRTIYLQFAACVLVLLVSGFVTFILFPAIPPWLAALRYGKVVGVVNQFGPVLRAHPLPFHGTPIFYVFKLSGDPIAAFPSEHAAFPLLELLAFRLCAPRWVAAILACWVAWVLFTVVYLGEHWVTDAIAGYVYAVAIFAAVRWLCRPSDVRLGTAVG